MSIYYSLVCHETRSKILIAKDLTIRDLIFSDIESIGRVARFLRAHTGMDLQVVSEHDLTEDMLEYTEFEEDG